MKKWAGFVLGLVLSSSVLALDKVTENVQAVCLSPSQQGNYWNVTAKGDINAEGLVRVIALGINGEAIFTKGEWEGIQQVLKEHQAGDNDSYRKCAEKLTPIFLEKFASIVPITSTKDIKKPKPSTIKTIEVNQETHGNYSGIFNSNNGDITINNNK